MIDYLSCGHRYAVTSRDIYECLKSSTDFLPLIRQDCGILESKEKKFLKIFATETAL